MATKTKSKTSVKSKVDSVSKRVKPKKVARPVVRKKTVKVVEKSVARKQAEKAVASSAAKSAALAIKSDLPTALPTAKPKPAARPLMRSKTKVKVKPASSYTPLTSEERRILRNTPPQFTYMKAPAVAHEFQVGDTVEVFCDHERSGERVRGWVKGIVVQVDNKLVAVQFRSNVFLTDGWMVPDRILWYPLTSDQIREITSNKRSARKEIPDY